MRVEYINPFIEGAIEVIRDLIGMQAQRGDLSLKASIFPCPQVTVVLGLVGQNVKGQVIYGMTLDTAKWLASKMMGGMPIPDMDEVARSAIGELGNMVTGRASSILEKTGINLDISPPTMVIGNDVEIAPTKARVLCVGLMLDATNRIEINVGLE